MNELDKYNPTKINSLGINFLDLEIETEDMRWKIYFTLNCSV